jgi:hypothetical protein
MDATGALSELGLTVPTSAEAIRRAYLRSVRAHPPERDPEGFRRVRDAYELLKDSPWLWTELSLREPDDDDDVDDNVATAMARIEEIAPTNRHDAAMARADEEPVQVAPPEDEDEKEDEDDESALEESFEGDLDESNDPLEQAMSSGDFERAADVLLEALGKEEVGEEPSFAPWQVQDVALRLYSTGKFRLGESLLSKFDGWIERRRLLPSAFGTVATARLTLLKELRALPGVVPAAVVTALATSVENGQFSSAAGTLEKAFKADENFEYHFRRQAPLLYAAASRHAGAWRKTTPAAQLRRLSSFPAWKFVIIAILLLQGARALRNFGTSSPEETAVADIGKSPNAALRDKALEEWHKTASAELDEGLQKGDCAKAREKWHMFLVTMGTRTESSQRVVDERRAAIVAKCPELEGKLR